MTTRVQSSDEYSTQVRGVTAAMLDLGWIWITSRDDRVCCEEWMFADAAAILSRFGEELCSAGVAAGRR